MIECIQAFSPQGSILALVVALCVTELIRTIQVISRYNILINVRLLGGRFWVVIPILSLSSSGVRNKLGLLRSSELFLIKPFGHDSISCPWWPCWNQQVSVQEFPEIQCKRWHKLPSIEVFITLYYSWGHPLAFNGMYLSRAACTGYRIVGV